jgi:hypothetical protein
MHRKGPEKDKSWLAENMEILTTLASESVQTKGRGAVIVDDKAPGQVPSLFYLPQAESVLLGEEHQFPVGGRRELRFRWKG